MGGVVRLFVRNKGIQCVYRRTFFEVGPLGDRELRNILEQISFQFNSESFKLVGASRKVWTCARRRS